MFSSSLLFLDFGGGEIILIFFVALMLFGGKKLPELARGLGKGIRDFKDASEGVKREINNQIDSFEAKKTANNTPQNTVASPVIADEAPAAEIHPADSVPVAEIQSDAAVVTENAEPAAAPTHLKETTIERAIAPDEPKQAEHEAYKS